MPKPPIIILGAGIGGLTLGRCLRQKGITSIIYEKATSSPRHNYGISLHEWAYKPLLPVLNMDEHSFRRRVAVDSLSQSGIGKIHPDGSPTSLDQLPGSFLANRSKLEHLLKEGQEIKWEHTLTHAHTSPDYQGSTILTFQNNLQITSSFTIDTLGVHSQLRKSLLPKCNPKVLPYVVFSGKRRIMHDEYLKTYTPYLKDANTLSLILKPTNAEGGRRNVLLQLQINSHHHHHHHHHLPNTAVVEISYIYSRPANPDQPDSLHHPHRPLSSATMIPEAFYSELQSLPSTHNDQIREPFLTTFHPPTIQQDRVLHWLQRIHHPPDLADLHNLLKENGVVMIGDSAHALPILGGEGACHAVKDGVELAGVIGVASASGGSTRMGHDDLRNTAVEDYYDKCANRWTEAALSSEERIRGMHCF